MFTIGPPLIERCVSLTVFVADASRMDCQLLTDAIQRQSNFQVVGSATRCKEAISKIGESRPDIALISVRLEDGEVSGILLLRELRALRLQTRVIMLVDENQPDLIAETFRCGARGIFCRSGVIAELRKCLQKVHEGQIWANNSQLECVVDVLTREPAPRLKNSAVLRALSNREEQIAHLVATGLSNREIAERLGLSWHTVRNYLFRIFEKLEISTRLELVLYVLSQVRKPPARENEAPDQRLESTS
jgi:DNA-binding NarL/FixJ family response regulator